MGGVAGIPNTGSTFCARLYSAIDTSYLWHEGIMQTVSGFVTGTEYTLSFYQAHNYPMNGLFAKRNPTAKTNDPTMALVD